MTETFGQKIVERRKSLGMAQEALARLIGRPWAYLNEIEHDRLDPNEADIISKLAEALEISESDLKDLAIQFPTYAEHRKQELASDTMAMIAFRRSRMRE